MIARCLALRLWFPALLSLPVAGVHAQNLLPNPGFEEGRDQPLGWSLSDGAGQWSEGARQGRRSVAVEGKGEDQSVWRTGRLTLAPGGLYQLKFQARRESGTGGGTAVAGTSRVNRDFQLDTAWLEKSYVFAAPAHGTSDYVRLGQWHVNGRLAFDDAELAPVMAVHATFADGLELGEAESVHGGVYRFHPQFGWTGANFHRPLLVNRAGFNSDRWIFSPGAEMVYRLAVSGHAQKSGQVRVAINYHSEGALRVEASRDGAAWAAVTNYDARQRGGVAALPSGLFPAKQIFVRLSQAGPGGGFQVNEIDYEAALAEPLPDAEGATHFLSVLHQAPEMAVRWQALQQSDPEGYWRLHFALTNLTRSSLKL